VGFRELDSSGGNSSVTARDEVVASPNVIESLAAACQVAAGEALGWSDVPSDKQLLRPFGHLAKPESHLEMIAARSILAEFVRRLGNHIHESFHRRYRAPSCNLSPPTIGSSTHELIPGGMELWLHDWLHGFRQTFEEHHSTVPQRARRLLERRFTEHLSSTDVAGILGVERRVLERRFRAEIGLNIGEYRTHLRVASAICQIRGGCKAEAAALLVGWKGKKDLYRASRTVAGILPTEVRGLSETEFDAIFVRVLASRDYREPTRHR
jgi:AraC-like DNA-binding protein